MKLNLNPIDTVNGTLPKRPAAALLRSFNIIIFVQSQRLRPRYTISSNACLAYAFGSGVKERTASFTFPYRFSMNTQEKEPELGEGVTSAEFWVYDGKLGRRWNVDPVIKLYESAYSCFGNSPLIAADKLGSDSFNVISKTLNAAGKPVKKGDAPLILFRVYTSGPQKIDMNSTVFRATYQISAENVSHKINDVEQAKPYAKVLKVYSENEHFKKVIHVTSLESLNKEYGRLKNLVGSEISFLEKLLHFRQGATGDYKKTTAKELPFTYIENIDIFQSEDIGNFLYGMILSNSGQNATIGMENGDALQSSYQLTNAIKFDHEINGTPSIGVRPAGAKLSGVDDYIDGYYIYAGANAGSCINEIDIRIKSFYSFHKVTTYSARTIYARGVPHFLDSITSSYKISRK
ncbi:MAG: hypothetical protein ACK5CL_03390 [Sphingomonadales bacterium]